jgi:hypothetical protein
MFPSQQRTSQNMDHQPVFHTQRRLTEIRELLRGTYYSFDTLGYIPHKQAIVPILFESLNECGSLRQRQHSNTSGSYQFLGFITVLFFNLLSV